MTKSQALVILLQVGVKEPIKTKILLKEEVVRTFNVLDYFEDILLNMTIKGSIMTISSQKDGDWQTGLARLSIARIGPETLPWQMRSGRWLVASLWAIGLFLDITAPSTGAGPGPG